MMILIQLYMIPHYILEEKKILFLDEDFSKVIFVTNIIGVLGVDLDKINLDDDIIFMKMILKLFFMT